MFSTNASIINTYPTTTTTTTVTMPVKAAEGTEVRRSISNGNWDVWNGVGTSIVSPNRTSFAPSPSPSPTLSNVSVSSPKTSVNHSEGKKLLPNNLSGLLVGAILQSLRQGPKSAADLRRSISSTVAWKGPANILFHQVNDTLTILESLGIAVPSTMPVPKLQRRRIASFSFSPEELANASRRRSSSAHYCPSPFFARPGPPRPTTASGEVLSSERIMNVDKKDPPKTDNNDNNSNDNNNNNNSDANDEEDIVRIKVANLKRKRSASQDAMEYAAAKAGSSAGAHAAAGRRGDVKSSGTFAEAANAVDNKSDNKKLKILSNVSDKDDDEVVANDDDDDDDVQTAEKKKPKRDRSDTQDSNSGFQELLNNKGAVLSSDLSKNINNMVRPTQERKMAQAKRAWHLEIIKLIRLGAYREVERRYGPKGLQSAIDYVKAERYPITSASNSSIETSGRKKPFFVHPQIPEDAQVMAREKNFIGIRAEWGNAVARNSYKWAWRNNLFYGTGEPLPGDARALARMGEFELIENEWGKDGRTCAMNWVGKQSELWLLEEEPQLMEIDAAQDMVLGEYDRLANNLLNLKNRRSYMRQQLALLARNVLNGAKINTSSDSLDNDDDDDLWNEYTNRRTNGTTVASVIDDIIGTINNCAVKQEKMTRTNNDKRSNMKFRNGNKVRALRSQIERIYNNTKALTVVCDKKPVTGYENFPKAVDFHGPFYLYKIQLN